MGPAPSTRALPAFWRATYALPDERRWPARSDQQLGQCHVDLCHVGPMSRSVHVTFVHLTLPGPLLPLGQGATHPVDAKSVQGGWHALFTLVARAGPTSSEGPLTRSVSRARRRASFPVDAPMPWAYQCDPAMARKRVRKRPFELLSACRRLSWNLGRVRAFKEASFGRPESVEGRF
jgi:hypothetical protein